ncbi:MAG: Mur ligase family protein [Hyphomicrobium sp.]|jgi:UDP-N-acetylmuramoyl-tripeptide--D-alanyl-D-alanine ligase|nr:Mur ligase family protein [Hyphomicrobium sp.]
MDAFRELGRSLKYHARLIEARTKRKLSKARFIAVTGSSGKTSTVKLLSRILEVNHKVKSQSDNNSEKSAIGLLQTMKRDDEFAVLEAGAGAPGRLEQIASVYNPDISIVTLVAIEHYSAFRKLESIAHEKGAIIRALPSNGLALLNYDVPEVRAMSGQSAAPVKYFGCTGGDYRACDLKTLPDGRLSFRIEYGPSSLLLDTRLIGEHNWLGVTAAVSCALELGVDPETIARCVAEFEPVPGRMSLHKIPQGPTFILDTCKAPFHSMTLPFTTLSKIECSRKRIIIGSISDYPGNPKPKYRDVYRAARQVADEVMMVGEHAHRVNALPEDLASGRFLVFSGVRQVFDHVLRTSMAGEVILVKSSQNLHLERIMLAFIEDVQCWPDQCGNKISCAKCGHFRQPFTEHSGKSKRTRAPFIRARPRNSPANATE